MWFRASVAGHDDADMLLIEGNTERAMGTWVAFAIGVSGALLLKMFVLQF